MATIERHLAIAQGYLELGMVEEALTELDEMEVGQHALPSVLAFKVSLYSAVQRWNLMESSARQMAQMQPENPGWWIQWAYATRRSKSLPEANQILLEAEKLHPEEPLIQFNLGCYACQLGNNALARDRVSKAIRTNGQFKLLAQTDADLEPIWVEIEKISGTT